MNPNDKSTTQRFKECAGRNCTNIATHLLTIIFFKRSGWFCSKCKKSLQEEGLVESIGNETVIKGEENELANR